MAQQPKMARFTIYLPKQMREGLVLDAQKSGIPEAEIARRILDEYYTRPENKARVDAQRQANEDAKLKADEDRAAAQKEA